MKLKKYLKEANIRQCDFRKGLCSKGHLSKIVNGKTTPSMKLANKIRKKSQNEVTLNDLAC